MTHALAVIDGTQQHAVAHAAPRLALLRPIAPVGEILVAQNEVREMIAQTLQEGRDYGKIPGTDKPTMYKAGAERVNGALGLSPRFRIVEREVDHDREVPWIKRRKIYEGAQGARRYVRDEETRGTSLGLYRYVVECELVHRESGQVVAACIGSCSTMESKYIDRPRDCENTALKMAGKRAYVGATLLAGGLSEQFTQDIEDMPREMFDKSGAGEATGGGAVASASASGGEPVAQCPKCGGGMWDNRATKTNPKAPDFKCKKKGECDGVLWPGEFPPKPPEMKAADAQAKKEHDAIKRAERKFPQNFPLKPLRGLKVGDATREQLGAALTAAREGGSDAWVNLLNEELDDRNLKAQSEMPLDGSTQVDVPPGGKVEGALAHNGMPAALADTDDDSLPF